MCALIYVIGGIFDLALLDARVQPWAKIDDATVSMNAKSEEAEKSKKLNLDLVKSDTTTAVVENIYEAKF